MAAADLGIASEIGSLQGCILSSPGLEFDAMVPGHIAPLVEQEGSWQANPHYLLFDDLVQLDHLQSEHAELRAVVAAVTGPRGCLDLRALLVQTLMQAEARAQVIDEVLRLEVQCGPLQRPWQQLHEALAGLDPVALAEALMTGLDPLDGAPLLATPAPNLLFARDVWAVVGDAILLGYPRSRARKRDGVLARAVARFHPLLRGHALLDVRGGAEGISDGELSDMRCLEGGDVMVVRADVVLIGLGERTPLQGATRAAQLLHARGVRHVLGVGLPMARATMHLDTVLTWIEPGRALAYLPALQTGEGARAVYDLLDDGRPIDGSLMHILGRLDAAPELVPCGGSDVRAAAREQWSDGANAFCLGPGRIVLYGRNTETLRVLNRLGYEVLTPAQLCANAALLCSGERRWVVALAGSELSRGRGGPRCLTLPLRRSA